MTDKKVGILFSVCDGDERHFKRFITELERLGFFYAVNFDHCSKKTKRLFQQNFLFLDGYENDDPESHFNEMHRQPALTILQREGFDWALSMDVDETLEKFALEKVQEIMQMDVDLVDCQLLDLWGDERHYRIDYTFARSHREKFFNLNSGRTNDQLRYYHPTSHAPKFYLDREAKVVKFHPLYVIHWGIMDQADAEFHTKRWDDIYNKAVGGNPYGFYPYINDPTTVPICNEYDYNDPNFIRHSGKV